MIAQLKNDYGNKLYNTKQYKSALPLYSEAIDISPNTATYYGNRAACFMMLKSFEEALEDVRKSVQLDPNFLKGYHRMTKCGLAIGEIRMAKFAAIKAQELQSDISGIANEVKILRTLTDNESEAYKAYKKGDFQKVVMCMEKCLALASTCNLYKLKKAECLTFLGRYQEAQDISTSVLISNENNVDAIYIRGLCLFYEENLDGAIKTFRHVLRLAPEHSKAMHNYKRVKKLKKKKEEGDKAYRACRFQEACKLYTEALEIDPLNKKTNAKLYFNRASVLSSLKKIQEAIADCTAALKLDGTFFKAMLKRAKCYMDLEEFEYAIHEFEKICKIDDTEENGKLLQDAKIALEQASKKPKDYYKILGVEENVSADEIKKAFRKKALMHHPDKHTEATEFTRKMQEKKFKEVGKAYAILSDPVSRLGYDISMRSKRF